MRSLERINQLISVIERSRPATPQERMYSESIKAKLRQALYCLEKIKDLETQAASITSQDSTTGDQLQPPLKTIDLACFYCESLWSALRASLDILAQLINQVHNLQIDENDVDYKQVDNKLNNVELGSTLQRSVSSLRRSKAFRDLEKYRHCSNHRRQVYIEARTMNISGTPGYRPYSGGSAALPAIQLLICKNPADFNPILNDTTALAFCDNLIQKIDQRIHSIVYNLIYSL